MSVSGDGEEYERESEGVRMLVMEGVRVNEGEKLGERLGRDEGGVREATSAETGGWWRSRVTESALMSEVDGKRESGRDRSGSGEVGWRSLEEWGPGYGAAVTSGKVRWVWVGGSCIILYCGLAKIYRISLSTHYIFICQ